MSNMFFSNRPQSWATTCRLMFCCVRRKVSNFEELAELMARMFPYVGQRKPQQAAPVHYIALGHNGIECVSFEPIWLILSEGRLATYNHHALAACALVVTMTICEAHKRHPGHTHAETRTSPHQTCWPGSYSLYVQVYSDWPQPIPSCSAWRS
jgi:hypothetical protein